MKRRLRPWVVNFLIITNFISICLLFGECDSDRLFIIKTVVCLSVFLFNSYTLYKLGGLEDGNIR